MSREGTRFDRILERIKNNRILAAVLLLGTIVIALSTFTDAVQNLSNLWSGCEHHPATDISGRWRTEETDEKPTYFDFKVVGNQVYGTVWIPPTFAMQDGESGIIGGRVAGKTVTFTTKHRYVKQQPRYDPVTRQLSPEEWAEFTASYIGKILGDEIRFLRQTESGYHTELTAKRIVDLTAIQGRLSHSASTESGAPGFTLVYELAGHEGGVWSLAFGPDKGRRITGGLRLASGGTTDCQVKYWDTATAEDCGADLVGPEDCKDRVTVMYRARLPGHRVDLLAVGVRNDGHEVRFFGWSVKGNARGGGTSSKEVPGLVGPLAVSRDLNLVATGETEGPQSTIALRDDDGVLQATLGCDGPPRFLAFGGKGSLLAAAETVGPGTRLKLWDAVDASLKWQLDLEGESTALAVAPDDSVLALARSVGNVIEIRNLTDGKLTRTLVGYSGTETSSLTFNDSGDLLAAGTVASGINLWNMATGRLLQTLEDTAPVSALALSRGGRLLATANSSQGKIKVWARPNL